MHRYHVFSFSVITVVHCLIAIAVGVVATGSTAHDAFAGGRNNSKCSAATSERRAEFRRRTECPPRTEFPRPARSARGRRFKLVLSAIPGIGKFKESVLQCADKCPQQHEALQGVSQ